MRRTERTQQAAAASLAAGASVTAAAHDAGVSRRTVQRWRVSDPDFRAKIEDAEAAMLDVWADIAQMAMAEVRRRLVEDAAAIDVRDLVGIATRAGHHFDAHLSRKAREAAGPAVDPLTDAERAEAIEAMRELAGSLPDAE
jgi:hypothetical protein